jgi:hypothetical protein
LQNDRGGPRLTTGDGQARDAAWAEPSPDVQDREEGRTLPVATDARPRKRPFRSESRGLPSTDN